MFDICEERVRREAAFIIENKATVRACAARFNLGKSTVHTDVTKKLRHIDGALYDEVRKVLGVNLSQRHLRGGYSTKMLYEKKKNGV